MLKVTATIQGKTVELPNPIPKTLGGSVTDYSVPGVRIIHWLYLENGNIEIFSSDKGISVEVGMFRETYPEAITPIKTLTPGESFELQIKSKFGDSVSLKFSL